jgi:hypothetical protein
MERKNKNVTEEDIINYNDIQNTHEIICEYFTKQEEKLDYLQSVIKDLGETAKTQPPIIRHSLVQYRDKMKIKYNDIKKRETFNKYLQSVTPILNKYRECCRPVYADQKFNIADLYVKLYNDIARRFFPVMTVPVKPNEGCENCQSLLIFTTESCRICKKCRYITWKSVNTVSYDDKERVNLNSRYKYTRKLFFKEAIKKYQGQQREDIPEDIKNYIDDFMQTNNIRPSRVTKHSLWSILKDGNYSKYNDFIHKIYYSMVKKPAPDISKYESDLLSDFDLQDQVYNEISSDIKEDRDNALNSFYILFKLLERYGYHVSKEEKDIFLKDRQRLISHDNIWREICTRLNWIYVDTV